MKPSRIPCLILALESDIGTGRNMEIYYRLLLNSPTIAPVMVYSQVYSYHHAPTWVERKVLYEIPNTTHQPQDCDPRFCKLTPHAHRTYEQWFVDCTKYIVLLRRYFGEKTLWLLDINLPEIEGFMGRYIVQVFHGELFDDGKSYFYASAARESFKRYCLMFTYGSLLKDKIITRCGIPESDPRFVTIGRTLNDSLYDGSLSQKVVLKSYGLNEQRKTILYSPTWKSKKIWSIGRREDDAKYLERFCNFAKRLNLNVIIRPHPISIYHYNVKPIYLRILKQFDNVYFDDTTHSSLTGPNQSLVAADIMVTDVTSLAVDYMSLGRPVIFLYPDSSTGLWGNGLPAYEQVGHVSYTVRTFPELFRFLRRLLTGPENQKDVQRRSQFVSYALAVRDGTSGLRFRQALESLVTHMRLSDFINMPYLRRYLSYLYQHRLHRLTSSVITAQVKKTF